MTSVDIVTVGNALVDLFAKVTMNDLGRFHVKQGIMHLIDEERAAYLHKAFTITKSVTGGSAANTAVGLASFSANVGFIGKVASDPLGDLFADEMARQNVRFITPRDTDEDKATGSCLIMVTPDSERTLNTCLGAGQHLSPKDISAQAELIQSAKVVYFEGYLWDSPSPREAIREAIRLVKQANAKTALTLSDPFCVDRFRDDFRSLIVEGAIDMVFANEQELLSLYQTDDFSRASRQLAADSQLGIITRGEKGCVVLESVNRFEIPALPVDGIVDLTGAGDQFAAGFLYGFCHGFDHQAAGELGCLAASEVITHFGALPEQRLKTLALSHNINLP